ncbi:tripartite tricarboxylate transporter substrate binding protein [Prauserella cavernicola]|uniref:Tripartite tricarboxylate transporter substrate binding protein n=1 Tax=Prauserella cavernicola TaxID=2800127 RepID=A0A934QUW4_9PSEU|nr:tripartite tricarboxylate transporter substrate binding protein [Prauserella cavernicola]MBK1786766.1 tripartite tricarboxylate transporter substrate binding protein [Prauserella cavernicola]
MKILSRNRTVRSAALFAAAALALSACSVQGGSGDGDGGGDYPTRPVEFSVPTEPGGSTDLVTRALAKSIEEPLGQSAVVLNKPGANGKIAGKDVFSSNPDGYRVAVMPQSLFAVGPLVLDDPDAVQLEDMTFIKGLAVEDYVMVVPADSPIKSVEDLKKAGNIKYGTTGAGTGSQLSQALLLGLQKVKATAVPFDGGGPTLTAVLGGKVDAAGLQIAEAFEQIKAGELRGLAVFSKERLDALPDVPTATELGYDVTVDQRRFVAAPAGLPDDVRDKLSSAIDEAVQSKEYSDVLESSYIGRWDADGAEVEKQLRESRDQFKTMTEELGVDMKGQS